jgi:serine/threonine-protein kinase
MVASETMDIDVGRVVAGKYELVRLLGRGSMGEVWSAHHLTLGEHVAIKLLTQAQGEALESTTAATARFQFEAQVAARLSRKTRHIVRVTDHGEEDGLAYLVMEQLEGETLEAVAEREQRVPAAMVTKIVTQVARALTQAHGEGVLHRDLKPANLFLTRDEEGKLLVKLLDFGIARAIHAHRAPSAFATAKGLVFGTPSYMSPEQAIASPRLDHRCDLWALATIAYEALSGALPVAGTDTDEILRNLCAGRTIPLHERRPDLSPALDAFFRRAFSGAIGGRFQSASDLAQAFARAAAVGDEREAATEPPDAEPTVRGGALETAPRMDRRRRARVTVLATGLSLLALLGVAMAWRALAAAPSATLPPSAPAPRPPTAAAAPLPAAVPLPGAVTDLPPPVPVASPPRVEPRAPLATAPARPSLSAPAAPPTPAVAAPTPAAPLPAPAPPPPAKQVDKSQVF